MFLQDAAAGPGGGPGLHALCCQHLGPLGLRHRPLRHRLWQRVRGGALPPFIRCLGPGPSSLSCRHSRCCWRWQPVRRSGWPREPNLHEVSRAVCRIRDVAPGPVDHRVHPGSLLHRDHDGRQGKRWPRVSRGEVGPPGQHMMARPLAGRRRHCGPAGPQGPGPQAAVQGRGQV